MDCTTWCSNLIYYLVVPWKVNNLLIINKITFLLFAYFIKDEWSLILKVQGIDSHIMSIQHLFDVIRSQELRMKVYLRIRINTLQTLCQTFCLVSANIILCLVLPVQVASLYLASINDGDMLETKPQSTFSHDTTNACTTKEYVIILNQTLFLLAHIEPVSTVSVFHNYIFIICDKSKCLNTHMHYTKV